ncbi:MAG: histidine phosphatase family protein [Cyclobacteriaceae bacterium]|nr:histidine phosphatase family protein [Cyclobacteriaceae bacterium]
MKTLILVRHAKSSWSEPGLNDFSRPLNERGKRDAPRMGKRFKEKALTPDRLISSSAKRAFDTCIIIAGVIGFPEKNIITDKNLYHADEEQILSIVQDLKEPDDVIMMFGHNPGFTDFANRLMNIHIDNIPTCGMVACALPVDKWSHVNWGSGKLIFFDFPKQID